jgi:flagellar basal body-associated protein FliL
MKQNLHFEKIFSCFFFLSSVLILRYRKCFYILGPEESDKNATTIIICVLAAMVIILVVLFVLYFVYKFMKRRSESKKYSPKGADIENIQPVQVKLLGYETSEKPVKNSQQQWNSDLLPVPKLSDEEKHVNLLSKAFDKTNCVKFDDGIY